MISPECLFRSRCLFGVAAVTSGSYLMQLSGSRWQSVLHMNLSQCNQPMVGFSARPLSSASAAGPMKATRPRTNTPCNIADRKLAHSLTTLLNINVWLYFLVLRFHPAQPGWPTRPAGQSDASASVTVQWRFARVPRHYLPRKRQSSVVGEKSADSRTGVRDYFIFFLWFQTGRKQHRKMAAVFRDTHALF